MYQLDEGKLNGLEGLVGKKILRVEYSTQTYTKLEVPQRDENGNTVIGELSNRNSTSFPNQAPDEIASNNKTGVEGHTHKTTASSTPREVAEAPVNTNTDRVAEGVSKSGSFAGAIRFTTEDGTVVEL